MKESRSSLKILTGKAIGKRPLENLRRKWEGSIRLDLRGIAFNTRNWINSAQNKNCYCCCECSIESPGSISHRVC